MQVRLFGELEAEQAGVPVPVHGTKQRALLALLALRPGQPVSADQLIDALWGDGQAAHPANALQAQIGQLRRTPGAAAVITTDAGYALDVGPDDVDASRFEQLVAALDWFVARGDADAALSLASGMAWLWVINSDFVEGARWLGDALGAKGPRRPELAATAQVWHGYFAPSPTSTPLPEPQANVTVAGR